MGRSIYIGFEPRESDGFGVAFHSMRWHLTHDIEVRGIVLDRLRQQRLYWRPTETRINPKGHPQLWDVQSEFWMSTEFAISRFLTPILAKGGYALFTDCDVLARADLVPLFEQAEKDPSKALWCVKHDHVADGVKMDGQVQSPYYRKNWSSVMLFNVEHPAHWRLNLDQINTLPGRVLHRFEHLQDDEIGTLSPEWNYLVGHTTGVQPKLVHFTDGIPSMAGYENCEFADEWRAARAHWGEMPAGA